MESAARGSDGNDAQPLSARVLRESCPLCLGRALKRLASPEPWKLVWCDHCHLAFLTNPPDYAATATEFDWAQTCHAGNAQRRGRRGRLGSTLSQAAREIRRHYRELTRRDRVTQFLLEYEVHGEVIDLGCGSGFRWSAFPATCVPVGIELSPALAERARTRLGDGGGRLIEADGLTGLRQLPAASAGAAIAISYFEHEVRPVEVARELHRVLRPGAIVIVKVPNYASWNRVLRGPRWCGFRYPDHVNYYTPRSLRALFEQTGFDIARLGWGDRMPTSDNMWCLARKC